MYFKDMLISTKEYFLKITTSYLFYLGGVIGGWFLYLTGLSIESLQKILIVIFADLASRLWAEKVNKRRILSRKIWYGFFGKFSSYMILFAAANHAFYISDILTYIVFGGFSIVEFRSIFENLREAKQKHLKPLEARIDQELDRFRNGNEPSGKE